MRFGALMVIAAASMAAAPAAFAKGSVDLAGSADSKVSAGTFSYVTSAQAGNLESGSSDKNRRSCGCAFWGSGLTAPVVILGAVGVGVGIGLATRSNRTTCIGPKGAGWAVSPCP